jgi:hypothetical protein
MNTLLILFILLIAASFVFFKSYQYEYLEISYKLNKDTNITINEKDIRLLLNQWKPTYMTSFAPEDDSLITILSNSIFNNYDNDLSKLPEKIQSFLFTDSTKRYSKQQFVNAIVKQLQPIQRNNFFSLF